MRPTQEHATAIHEQSLRESSCWVNHFDAEVSTYYGMFPKRGTHRLEVGTAPGQLAPNPVAPEPQLQQSGCLASREGWAPGKAAEVLQSLLKNRSKIG